MGLIILTLLGLKYLPGWVKLVWLFHRYPDKNESHIRRKLTEDLAALEQDASIRDIYNVSRRMLDWLRPRDLEKAKEMANYFDAYIKEQMSNG